MSSSESMGFPISPQQRSVPVKKNFKEREVELPDHPLKEKIDKIQPQSKMTREELKRQPHKTRLIPQDLRGQGQTAKLGKQKLYGSAKSSENEENDSPDTTSSEMRVSTTGESSSLEFEDVDTTTKEYNRMSSEPLSMPALRPQPQRSVARSLTSTEQREALSEKESLTLNKKLDQIHKELEKSIKDLIQGMTSDDTTENKLKELRQTYNISLDKVANFNEHFNNLKPEFQTEKLTTKLELVNNQVIEVFIKEISTIKKQINEIYMSFLTLSQKIENHLKYNRETYTYDKETQNSINEKKETLHSIINKFHILDNFIKTNNLNNKDLSNSLQKTIIEITKLNYFAPVIFQGGIRKLLLDSIKDMLHAYKQTDQICKSLCNKNNVADDVLNDIDKILDETSSFRSEFIRQSSLGNSPLLSNKEHVRLTHEMETLNSTSQNISKLKQKLKNLKNNQNITKEKITTFLNSQDVKNVIPNPCATLDALLLELTNKDNTIRESVKIIQKNLNSIEDEYVLNETNKIIFKKLSNKEIKILECEIERIKKLNTLSEIRVEVFYNANKIEGIADDEILNNCKHDLLNQPNLQVFDYIPRHEINETALKNIKAKLEWIKDGIHPKNVDLNGELKIPSKNKEASQE